MVLKNTFVCLIAALVAFNFIQAKEGSNIDVEDIENAYESDLYDETGERRARAAGLPNFLSNINLTQLTNFYSRLNQSNLNLPIQFGVNCTYNSPEDFASCSCTQAVRCFPGNMGYSVNCSALNLGCQNGHCSLIAALSNNSTC